jgi:hypothetical protein
MRAGASSPFAARPIGKEPASNTIAPATMPPPSNECTRLVMGASLFASVKKYKKRAAGARAFSVANMALKASVSARRGPRHDHHDHRDRNDRHR